MIKNLRLVTSIAFTVLLGLFFLSPAAAVAQIHLKVGYLPVTGHAKFFVAKEQGFFKQEGINAELVEFINSADGINAIRASKIDIGAFGTTAPLVHIAQGADLRIIGGIMGEDAAIVTLPNRAGEIRKISDLKGKKVATVRLATGDAVLRGALFREGLDWKKDLSIFELKNPPAVIEAVKSRQVDAGVIWGPFDITAEKEGLTVVIRSDTLSPGHPCCRVTVTGAALQQKRDAYVKFLRALLRAERFSKDNKTATVAAINKYVKLDKAIIEKAFYHGHLDQSSDPNVTEVRNFWTTMQKSGFITSNLDISSFIDVTLYKDALDGLAKENPKSAYWKGLQKTYAQRNNVNR